MKCDTIKPYVIMYGNCCGRVPEIDTHAQINSTCKDDQKGIEIEEGKTNLVDDAENSTSLP